jgi:hypothetical protein
MWRHCKYLVKCRDTLTIGQEQIEHHRTYASPTQPFEPVGALPNPFHLDRNGGKNRPDHTRIGGIVLNEKYAVMVIVHVQSPDSKPT